MALYEIDGVDTADMDRGELLDAAMDLLEQRDALADVLLDVLRESDGIHQANRDRAVAALKQLEE